MTERTDAVGLGEPEWEDDAIARLTRERDAALEALRDVVEIFFYDSRPMEWVARGMRARAQRTIQAIETGAIHNDQS